MGRAINARSRDIATAVGRDLTRSIRAFMRSYHPMWGRPSLTLAVPKKSQFGPLHREASCAVQVFGIYRATAATDAP
jgi:hypothetical protein